MVSLTNTNKYTEIADFLVSKIKPDLDSRNHKTVFDGERKPVLTVSKYLNRIMEGISDGEDYNWCITVALIYIKRIRDNGIILTEYNIHRLMLTSILIAVKYWDDNYTFNEQKFIEISGVRNETELYNLQIEFLVTINWKLFIEKIDYENMDLFYMTLF